MIYFYIWWAPLWKKHVLFQQRKYSAIQKRFTKFLLKRSINADQHNSTQPTSAWTGLPTPYWGHRSPLQTPTPPPPHTHPTPHQPHRGSWAGPWNLMTSLSLPSWNSKPCCSPLAYSYHLHGNLTSSCFPIGFMEQDTQKGFPFCPHCLPAKMMLSTGTWAKFSHLRFCVLWLRKHGNILLPIVYPPLNHTQRGCFSFCLAPDSNSSMCWAFRSSVPRTENIPHSPPPIGRGKNRTITKTQLGHFTSLSAASFYPKSRREKPCLHAEQYLPSDGTSSITETGVWRGEWKLTYCKFCTQCSSHRLTYYGNWSRISHPSSTK